MSLATTFTNFFTSLCTGLYRSGLVLFLLLSFFFISHSPVQALTIYNLEQQLNISNGEFSTASTTDSPTDNSLGLVHFDSADYTSGSVYFEAVIKCIDCTGGNGRVSAGLYNSAGAVQTTVVTTSGNYSRMRTISPVSLSTGDYTVRFKVDATSGTAYLKAARLIIIQTAAGGLTDTQAQIELGGYQNSTSTTATSLTAPKYYLFDSSQYSGTVNAYFEATIKTADNTSASTYQFNDYDAGVTEWTTTPANMVDGSTATFASTTTDADVELLTANANSGTDLGTITKVEVQAYAYQSTDTTGSITLTPIFSGTNSGDGHSFNPGTSADWSTYADITSDTNAPSTWTWADVQNLDLNVTWNANAGSNTGYLAQANVRVTYENNTVISYAQLYNLSQSAVVTNSLVATSSNSYHLVRGSLPLTTNFNSLDQYEVRIYTNSISNPVYISNAKLIIDQTQTTGIQQTETIQSYLTTLRTQTNTLYTQESFLNEFDPSHFAGGNNLEAYFEATMRTTGGTAYAQLYDVAASDPMDTPVTSEVTTDQGSLVRRRSSDLISNTDWPSSAHNFDTILKASDSQTTSVSSSWLIIRAGAVDPEITFTIEGVPQGETHNGVTTSVTSTITSLSFDHVTVGVPVYAAHKLTITVNQAPSSYTADVILSNPLQGQYPANNIDPFIGGGASWSSPQSWTSPTGTTANTNTGWIGANTSDTDVGGWGSGSSLFGPISDTAVQVANSTEGVTKTIYVSYGLEVNANQPADSYVGTLIYNILPKY